jgi:hypothetical protein
MLLCKSDVFGARIFFVSSIEEIAFYASSIDRLVSKKAFL